jgi:HPt (histidine-containing phosphotransfer) domain-containing protein
MFETEKSMAVTRVRGADDRPGDTGCIHAAAAAGEQQAIDEEHLRHVTLGDARLEREVLQIFVRQTVAMLERIAGGKPIAAAAAAHTLMGSARGIGAWRLAGAAERLERASAAGNEEALGEALAELKAASLEASTAIAARLRAPAS